MLPHLLQGKNKLFHENLLNQEKTFQKPISCQIFLHALKIIQNFQVDLKFKQLFEWMKYKKKLLKQLLFSQRKVLSSKI